MRRFFGLFSVWRLSDRLILIMVWATMATTSVDAATLIVTNTSDNGPGSLRAVIGAASNGDTVQFDPALKGQTIFLTSGELGIDKNVMINGLGPDLLAVSRIAGMGPFRIFHVTPGYTVTLAGLTISGGAQGSGGGIFNEGSTLTISNCIVSGNLSDAGGGGGGILNEAGTLTIVDSKVSSNRASFTSGDPLGFGGGINSGGTLTIMRSSISDNTAAIDGGGIIAEGMITVIDSNITGNRAGSDNLLSGIGGGLYVSGTTEIRNSTISGNI